MKKLPMHGAIIARAENQACVMNIINWSMQNRPKLAFRMNSA